MNQAPYNSIVIYPAHGRGTTASPGRKCRHTLGDQAYPNGRAFAGLRTMNDEMLGPGEVNICSARPGNLSIIVPLEGALRLTAQNVDSGVDVGSVAVFTTVSICAVNVRNAYQASWVNYLEITAETDSDNTTDRLNLQLFDFDIASLANQIVSLSITSKITMHFGRYQGRVDGEMKLHGNDNLFAYVIDGICEMNDRLLEARDALALRNVEAVSFESLSPESVVMMIQGI